MKNYQVQIRATVTKTLTVTAANENEASELAHQQFSVLNDDEDEAYEQDTLEIKEVKK